MSKNNLIIAISAFLILVLSVGSFLVFNSQNSPKNSANFSDSQKPSNSQAQLTKDNETNDIKINQTGTINPRFQSSETKEKYGVDFDPCKMLTPEITEKYADLLKFGSPKLLDTLKNGEVGCYSQNAQGSKNFLISITDNNNKFYSLTKEKLGAKKMIEEFKSVLSKSDSSAIFFKDNTFLMKTSDNSTEKGRVSVFLINNYRIEIIVNSKEEVEKINFENFVKEFYESIKF